MDVGKAGEPVSRPRRARQKPRTPYRSAETIAALAMQLQSAVLSQPGQMMREHAAQLDTLVAELVVPMEEPARSSSRAPSAMLSAKEKKQTDAVRAPRKLDNRTKAAMREIAQARREHPPPEIERRYRMAYCATVSLYDTEGKALQTIRYGRMPPAPNSLEAATHRNIHRLMERLCGDVRTLRAKRTDMAVVLLAGGAPELWSLFDKHINEKTIGAKPIQLVDAWHALEYVAAAARLLEQRRRRLPGTFRKWRKLLLESSDGAQRVLATLQRAGLRTASDEAGKQPVGDAIRYIHARLDRMAYAEAHDSGFPIGSGTVEATCKSLVSLRMRRAGSRWKPKTGNEVLQPAHCS